MPSKPDAKRNADYEAASAWLRKNHGSERRETFSDGYQIIARVGDVEDRGLVTFTGDDDDVADYEGAFIDAVTKLREKLA